MVDVKMGGGDDPDRHERALHGVDTEFLNSLGGADAAAIDNHQAIFLIRDQVCLSNATAWDWMNHVCHPFRLRPPSASRVPASAGT